MDQQNPPNDENHTVPPETHESWRAWLMTGARRTPVDKRRLRGANKGLKKILLEGLTDNGNGAHKWQDFSGAMVRHAVDDAMRTLPPDDKRVVKLAYFGGLSNREIASEVGMTEGTVQRRLRRALAAISDHIQHGQAMGRRALYGLAALVSLRWLRDHPWWTAAAATGAALVVVATPPVASTIHNQLAPPAAQPASRSGPASAPAQAPAAPIQVKLPSAAQSLPVPVRLPGLSLPAVKVPPVPSPSLPSVVKKIS